MARSYGGNPHLSSLYVELAINKKKNTVISTTFVSMTIIIKILSLIHFIYNDIAELIIFN